MAGFLIFLLLYSIVKNTGKTGASPYKCYFMNIILLITGAILGYLISRLLSGAEEGQQKRFKSMKFAVKNYIIHLHHWFLMSVVLIMLWFFNVYSGLILGFVAGTIIQGLTYRDFYRLVYRKRENKEATPQDSLFVLLIRNIQTAINAELFSWQADGYHQILNGVVF